MAPPGSSRTGSALVVVIGVGNEFRRDDGADLAVVVDAVRADPPQPGKIAIRTSDNNRAGDAAGKASGGDRGISVSADAGKNTSDRTAVRGSAPNPPHHTRPGTSTQRSRPAA